MWVFNMLVLPEPEPISTPTVKSFIWLFETVMFVVLVLKIPAAVDFTIGLKNAVMVLPETNELCTVSKRIPLFATPL